MYSTRLRDPIHRWTIDNAAIFEDEEKKAQNAINYIFVCFTRPPININSIPYINLCTRRRFAMHFRFSESKPLSGSSSASANSFTGFASPTHISAPHRSSLDRPIARSIHIYLPRYHVLVFFCLFFLRPPQLPLYDTYISSDWLRFTHLRVRSEAKSGRRETERSNHHVHNAQALHASEPKPASRCRHTSFG